MRIDLQVIEWAWKSKVHNRMCNAPSEHANGSGLECLWKKHDLQPKFSRRDQNQGPVTYDKQINWNAAGQRKTSAKLHSLHLRKAKKSHKKYHEMKRLVLLTLNV